MPGAVVTEEPDKTQNWLTPKSQFVECVTGGIISENPDSEVVEGVNESMPSDGDPDVEELDWPLEEEPEEMLPGKLLDEDVMMIVVRTTVTKVVELCWIVLLNEETTSVLNRPGGRTGAELESEVELDCVSLVAVVVLLEEDELEDELLPDPSVCDD
ncbi:hypothetical protein LTR67_000005 [Exophiala xenobiotica]